MNPTTPTSAMSQGATFVRPGAMAWGQGLPGRQAPASPVTSAAIEHALAAAVKDPDTSATCSTSLAEDGSGFRCPTPARSPTDQR